MKKRSGPGSKDPSEKSMVPAHVPPSVGASRALSEMVMKEEACMQKFEANSHLYKKSRNPTKGELTPRDDAEYLIPFEKVLLDKMKTTSYTEGTLVKNSTVQFNGSKFDGTLTRKAKISVMDADQVDSMKRHKEKLDHEIAQMQKVAQYKQYLLQYH